MLKKETTYLHSQYCYCDHFPKWEAPGLLDRRWALPRMCMRHLVGQTR